MRQRIIFQTDDGGVAVIIPAPDTGLTIEQLAAKDVPADKAYKIVDVDEIPSDRTFRSAWEVDEATLTDRLEAPILPEIVYNEFPVEEVINDNG